MVRIHESDRYSVESQGNGMFILATNADGEQLFFQGDDAATLYDEAQGRGWDDALADYAELFQ